ncbi:MAG: long-chain fatty acid--CoA ligase [Deltaproteobacteria bacterium]|nr:long-chain fatty acid--CoA ligase [Deltaproteobacteria bacterium]
MSQSIVQTFTETVRGRPDGIAARFRDSEGVWTTRRWAEMDRDRRVLAAGLMGLGLVPGERVAILANSSYAWMLADLAIQSCGGETVPIYQSLLSHECAYIVGDSGAAYIFAEDPTQLAKLLTERAHIPSVRAVILMSGRIEDVPGAEGATTTSSAGGADDDAATRTSTSSESWVRRWQDVVADGEAMLSERSAALDACVAALSPSSVLTIIYTSGTTGPPKGVVLTHANMLYEIESVRQIGLIGPEDIEFLYLPMAHSFAKVLQSVWFGTGHEMAIDSELTRITQNLAELRPTVVASVPRIFEKVYATVVGTGVSTPGLKGKLFRWTVGVSDRYARHRIAGEPVPVGVELSLLAAKRLVLSKVNAKLSERFGGRLRFFISGGAPLPKKIAHFFANAGITILEGYGLTETSAATCVNRAQKNKIGTVGPALPGTELRIADDGEILVRGPGVMRGYHNQPDATREVLSPDGWFSTGDVGRIDADGYLMITDRKKDIIVTAGGKNVAPQNLENLLKAASPLIGQVMVHGDRRKFLSALITLEPDQARALATASGLSSSAYADVAASKVAVDAVQTAIDKLNAQLPQFETIKRFAILTKDFEVGDELTPTLKVKRRVCEAKYRALLDGFYDEKPE